MFTFIIVLIALIAILITLVVLVQSGKGGGLAGIAAGGATQQILGTRQAPDVLEKATWMLVTLFIVLCVVSNFTIGQEQVQESVIQQRAQEEQATPALPPVGEQQELPSLPEPAPAEE
ncbi:MAG: preprotein translocase subunit SecG [Bacteroidetes bacterium SB0662_bin_6]|nr:preprotein translocase subunit SecG [Bacteroidetes bacterium SB0668_bin_1]MYE05322.1 preprotein translocase subunit SecG [Bacteroidetes bacterium SB0662_bin_6]